MDLIKRENVPVPVLPSEVVSVAGLGDVEVRCMLLDERLAYGVRQGRAARALEGESAAETEARVGAEGVVDLVAQTVRAADGEPLFTREQWRAWGARNEAEVMRLFEVAWRICGLDSAATQKN